MARRIIILDRPVAATFRYVLWADVPAARQRFYANPDAQSAFLDATAAELTALRSGAVSERIGEINASKRVAGGYTPLTLPEAQALLQAAWQAFQAEVSAAGAGNPWQRYGTSWDGTSWTAGGVA